MEKRRNYIFKDGRQFVLDNRTLIMGILNGTPDSFSDGGEYNLPETAANRAKQIELEGAHIVDFGVESTRPNYVPIAVEEEIARMETLLSEVYNATSLPISIDTYRAKSADYALSHGAHILNDIWGFRYDPEIADVAAQYGAPVILMHNQEGTDYDDIIDDIKAFFMRSVDIAVKAGIPYQNIWVDPGIGFGKTNEQNIEVIQRLGELTAYEFPVLLAPSRKRFIGSILNEEDPKRRDEGTVAVCIAGIVQGVDMVRVHNVDMHRRAIAVADAILRGE